MKKFSLSALAVGISMVLMTSCIGSFGLSSKVLKWNKSVSNDKFINELIFLGLYIIPVYEVSYFLDVVLFNSVEFWTGSSPVAGVDKAVKGEKGEYHVKSTANGYHVELIGSNQSADFVFNPESQTWTLEENGKSMNLVQFVDENNAKVFFGNESMTVNAANSASLYAAN
jgi:hypothetical protein